MDHTYSSFYSSCSECFYSTVPVYSSLWTKDTRHTFLLKMDQPFLWCFSFQTFCNIWGMGQTPLLTFYCSFSILLVISLRIWDSAGEVGRKELSCAFCHLYPEKRLLLIISNWFCSVTRFIPFLAFKKKLEGKIVFSGIVNWFYFIFGHNNNR